MIPVFGIFGEGEHKVRPYKQLFYNLTDNTVTKRFFALFFLVLGIIQVFPLSARATVSIYAHVGDYPSISGIYGYGAYIPTVVPLGYTTAWYPAEPVRWADPTLNARLAEYGEQKRLAREALKAQLFGMQAARVPSGPVEYPQIQTASPSSL